MSLIPGGANFSLLCHCELAGIDPSTYSMMQNMRAEKAAAEAAEAAKVAAKSEPGCSASPGWTPLSGKKRPAEDNTREATGHGSASVPPGFSTRQKRKLQHAPDRHDAMTATRSSGRRRGSFCRASSRRRGSARSWWRIPSASSRQATSRRSRSDSDPWRRRSIYGGASRRGCTYVLMSLAASARNAGGELRDVLVGARTEAP